MRKLISVLLAFFLFTGCGKIPEKTIKPIHLSFDTTDEMIIYGDYYYQPRPSPLLILLHMYGHNRTSWQKAIPYWHAKGFEILAIDMRGHGKSKRKNGEIMRYTYPKKPEDNMFLNAWKDVEGALKYMRKYKNCYTEKTIIIGASIGCSVALHCAQKIPQIKGAVLLSPGTNYLMVDSLEHIKKFAPRKLLMVSDKKEADACLKLIESGGYDKNIRLEYKNAGHGTFMLDSKWDKTIIRKIGDWLETNFM